MQDLVFHHKQKVVDGIHISYSFEYDDAANRENATGFALEDLTKLAYQKNDRTFWTLISIDPVLWSPVNFPADVYGTLHRIASIANIEAKLVNLKDLAAGTNITLVEPGNGSLVINANVKDLIAGENITIEEQDGGLIVSSSGGVVRHSELPDLHLDHHIQYLNVTRHQTPGLHELTRVVGGMVVGTVPHDSLDGLTNVTINNDTLELGDVLMFRDGFWQNLPLQLASNTQNGLMSKIDKIKLDSLAGASDVRLKKNITAIEHALGIVQQMRGIYYYWDKDNERVAGFGEQREIGLIAQEIEKIAPELVSEDERGYKMVNYSRLTVLLLEAIKTLKQEIDNIKSLTDV